MYERAVAGDALRTDVSAVLGHGAALSVAAAAAAALVVDVAVQSAVRGLGVGEVTVDAFAFGAADGQLLAAPGELGLSGVQTVCLSVGGSVYGCGFHAMTPTMRIMPPTGT